MSAIKDLEKEEFVKSFMAEEGLKGKSKRIKIMRIIDTVGFNKKKIKIALKRSTLAERIKHE